MKKLVFTGCALLALVALAAPPPRKNTTSKRYTTPEEIAAHLKRAREIRYKHTGGQVVRPGSQKGSIVYVNCQKSAPDEWINANATNFAAMTKFAISVESGTFSLPNPKVAGTASLFVIDDAAMPSLLSAPEQKWVMVNIAPLKSGRGEKEAFFRARVAKQLTRGFCLLAGSQTSNYPNSLVGCVTKPDDLDQFVDCTLPVDVIARFKPYVSGYGITPADECLYIEACQEGWAAAPTNDVQKAIWDKVHEMPTKPLKIEYNEKRDKGK